MDGDCDSLSTLFEQPYYGVFPRNEIEPVTKILFYYFVLENRISVQIASQPIHPDKWIEMSQFVAMQPIFYLRENWLNFVTREHSFTIAVKKMSEMWTVGT